MTTTSASKTKKHLEQEQLAKYWEEKRRRVLDARRNIWARRLDRDRVVADRSCFFTGNILLLEAIELLLLDEGDRAAKFLDTAEFYFEEAIRTDDLSNYGRTVGQEDLGRATRLAKLTLVRWIRDRNFDHALFQQACAMKEDWNTRLFSEKEWERTGFQLREWMMEKLILGQVVPAIAIYERYSKHAGAKADRSPEAVLHLVARYLADPKNLDARALAEQAIDALYSRVTKWMSGPGKDDMFNDEKLLVAYLRGRYFKGIEDPVRLIKMMRLRE